MTVETNQDKRKVKSSAKCTDGMHTFIVTGWRISVGKQLANKMMCQHCLVQIEMNEVAELWKQSESRPPEIKA